MTSQQVAVLAHEKCWQQINEAREGNANVGTSTAAVKSSPSSGGGLLGVASRQKCTAMWNAFLDCFDWWTQLKMAASHSRRTKLA